MATIKSYTDINQSKKLAKILPLESADMWWVALNWQETEYYVEVKQDGINQPKKAIPCWSFTALFKLLPKSAQLEKGNVTELYRVILPVELETSDWYIDPIDACVAMIERLHELKMF